MRMNFCDAIFGLLTLKIDTKFLIMDFSLFLLAIRFQSFGPCRSMLCRHQYENMNDHLIFLRGQYISFSLILQLKQFSSM